MPNEGTSEDAAESGDKIVFATAGDKGGIQKWRACLFRYCNFIVLPYIIGRHMTPSKVISDHIAVTYDHQFHVYMYNIIIVKFTCSSLILVQV